MLSIASAISRLCLALLRTAVLVHARSCNISMTAYVLSSYLGHELSPDTSIETSSPSTIVDVFVSGLLVGPLSLAVSLDKA